MTSNSEAFAINSYLPLNGSVPSQVAAESQWTFCIPAAYWSDFREQPEVEKHPYMKHMMGSPLFQDRWAHLEVEFSTNELMALQEQIVKDLSQTLDAPPELPPLLKDLCAFRACSLKKAKAWPQWPARLLESRTIESFDYREADYKSLCYAYAIHSANLNAESQPLWLTHWSKDSWPTSFEAFYLHHEMNWPTYAEWCSLHFERITVPKSLVTEHSWMTSFQTQANNQIEKELFVITD